MGVLTLREPGPRVRFAERGAFSRDLDTAAKVYFEGAESRRDVLRMYLKSVIILTWFFGSWALLVFGARNMWEGALCAVSLGLAIAGVGMSVQHDANHGATSKYGVVNRAFGATLDMMGVSSFIWRPKHNIAHHTFTNVEGVDFDLDFGSLARLSPSQSHRPWHRYQHFYLWFFYGFLLPKWVFFDDFVVLRTQLIGIHKLPRLDRRGLAGFVGWKVFFVAWSMVIPALYHPIWQVLVFHLIAVFTLGWTLGTIFQLAHCVREADFPLPVADRVDDDFAMHQLATTVDFGADNGLLTWFAGGLNYQVEHHLFPKVCHIHYPGLAKVVAKVALAHGLEHRRQATFGGALASHFLHLRNLGRPTAASE